MSQILSWQDAKVTHATLICKMKRGSVQWEDGDISHQIHREHAQNHVSQTRQNWDKQDQKTPVSARIFRTIPEVSA